MKAVELSSGEYGHRALPSIHLVTYIRTQQDVRTIYKKTGLFPHYTVFNTIKESLK